MEKIAVGWSMATRWTDPPLVIMAITFIPPLVAISGAVAIYLNFCEDENLKLYIGGWLAGLFAFLTIVWKMYINWTGSCDSSKYITLKSDSVAQYATSRIPIATLCDEFLEGNIDFNGDVLDILENHRNEFVNYKLTWQNLRFLILQLFPNHENSSIKHKKATKKEIAEHYDRGNDFFEAFMGPSMVYTSAFFRGLDQSLEQAQDNKMCLICDKLQLKEGETFLDIGCGWGTLVRHAALRYGAQATGVTLSVEGAAWCNDRNRDEGCEDKVTIINKDYRDIPTGTKFNKIASIEMAEHVGLANFQIYLNKVKELLDDDGLFLMQVAGLRQGSNWEDIAWGLFMSRYIFPGADASTPLNWYIRQLEVAGLEVHSVETIGRHYSWTLRAWYHNWIANREEMEESYGERLCRLWEFFLAWSTIAAGQGSATCYQIVSHKNIYDFPRDRWAVADDETNGTGTTSGQFHAVGVAKRASSNGRSSGSARKGGRTPKASGGSRRRASTPRGRR